MYDTLSRIRVRESKHASDNQDARTDELCKLNVALVARESRVNDFPAFTREKSFHHLWRNAILKFNTSFQSDLANMIVLNNSFWINIIFLLL